MSRLQTQHMSWLQTQEMSWLQTQEISWLQTQQMSWLQTIRRLLSPKSALHLSDVSTCLLVYLRTEKRGPGPEK